MPTLAQLFAEGYEIGESIPRKARARAAARKKYGAVAEDPGLFQALQDIELGERRDQRAQQQVDYRQEFQTRRDARATEQHDFDMRKAKADSRKEATLSLINGLRAARDRGEDVGAAFDKLTQALPDLGIDPGDMPTMKQQLLDDPAILDDYFQALQSGTKITPAQARAAAKTSESDAVAKSQAEKAGDLVMRLDRLADPSRESIGRRAIGFPTPRKALGGGFGGLGTLPATEARNYASEIEALKADVRSWAFETLKGGGHITELESEFAADAIGKLDRSTTWEHFQEELGRLREYIHRLGDVADRRKSGEQVADITSPEGVRAQAEIANTIYPGFCKNGFCFKGGKNIPENWIPESEFRGE